MTRLDGIARTVFHEHDDKLLAYLKEEGQSIEPQWCACLVSEKSAMISLETSGCSLRSGTCLEPLIHACTYTCWYLAWLAH